MGYDIIGDIDGHARTLEALLSQLDYTLEDEVYRHPTRRVVFLGDFVDRGVHQRDTLAIVRAMVDSGSAMAVMGNHEFNAIAYATADARGDHLIDYGFDQPPVFLGHYWLAGKPAPLEQHVACLDYSVARPGGQLVAYRWNGENELCEDAFVSVERIEA